MKHFGFSIAFALALASASAHAADDVPPIKKNCAQIIEINDPELTALDERIRAIQSAPSSPKDEFLALASLFDLRNQNSTNKKAARFFDTRIDDYLDQHSTLRSMLVQGVLGLQLEGYPFLKMNEEEAKQAVLAGARAGVLRNRLHAAPDTSPVRFVQNLYLKSMEMNVLPALTAKLSEYARELRLQKRSALDLAIAEVLEQAPSRWLLELDGFVPTTSKPVRPFTREALFKDSFKNTIARFAVRRGLGEDFFKRMLPSSFEFLEIPAGTYEVGVGPYRRNVTITQPFQIARVLIPQGIAYAVDGGATSAQYERQDATNPSRDYFPVPRPPSDGAYGPREHGSILLNHPTTNRSKIGFQRLAATITKEDPEWQYSLVTEAEADVAALFELEPNSFWSTGHIWRIRADDYSPAPASGIDPVFQEPHSFQVLVTGGLLRRGQHRRFVDHDHWDRFLSAQLKRTRKSP